jgi:16S rRNA (cytidine1402-2'-O)-methyltransferase
MVAPRHGVDSGALRGTAAEVAEALAARDVVKGEITLLVGRPAVPPPDDTPIAEAVAACERAGMSRMDAIKTVAKRRGLPKREVYRLAQESEPKR